MKDRTSMTDNVIIKTDECNIYIDINAISKRIGRIALSIIILLLFILWAFAFSNVLSTSDESEKGKIIVGLSIPCFLSLFLSIRYLLWNTYGVERLIINRKAISYSYNYGVIETPLKSVLFNDLTYCFKITKREDNEDYGEIMFFQYNPKTNLPELLHQTTLQIKESRFQEIKKYISKVFDNEIEEDDQMSAFSLN